MLTKTLECMVEQTLNLSAQRTLDAKWYIINRWNETHDDPIVESAVQSFLCNEQSGALTDEQRTFAKVCKDEVYACYRSAVFRMVLYLEMRQRDLVCGLEDFCSVLSSQKTVQTDDECHA